jgi:penicillin-insensitive murein endopeptidase
MRRSRNRYHGHPNLIAFIKRLGRQADTWGKRILIGDLSQPLGGPMAFGHSSHQIGLDADIWFRLIAREQPLSGRRAEGDPMRSVVRTVAGQLDHSRWSPYFRDLLKLSAEAPEVERIFVNPVIKQVLCRQEHNRSWLRKIRPWWGHDAHFHVRIRCPRNSPGCRPQKPPPPGDGCDASLDKWVENLQSAALAPAPKREQAVRRKAVVLPERCMTLLGY